MQLKRRGLCEKPRGFICFLRRIKRNGPEKDRSALLHEGKIGYTLGDLGCCFTEQYRAMYLSIFYTLILQVNPFHVGILLLVTKIWDAVNDPIIGAIVDSRKATKGGKFIPWIRAFSFPMAVLCILGFVNVGNINYGLRLAYMFVTYVLYEALYTCVNVPFGTLSSVMTDDVSQRSGTSTRSLHHTQVICRHSRPSRAQMQASIRKRPATGLLSTYRNRGPIMTMTVMKMVPPRLR